MYFSMDAKRPILDLLAEHPLRFYHDAAFFEGRAAPVTITLTNAGASEMKLPGLAYRDGVLRLGHDLHLSLAFDSDDGPAIAPRAGKVVDSPDLPDIVLNPGEELSIIVDRAALFALERPGFYFVRLDISGHPPQPGGCFMVIDPVKVLG